jgi:hypothetical protein
MGNELLPTTDAVDPSSMHACQGRPAARLSETIAMKLRAILIILSLAGFAGAAAAGQTHKIMQSAETIALLSQATGLTTHEVEIALGPSANYEQPVRYASVIRRFRQALGRTMYEQIMGGGELGAHQVQELAAMAQARQARLAAGK